MIRFSKDLLFLGSDDSNHAFSKLLRASFYFCDVCFDVMTVLVNFTVLLYSRKAFKLSSFFSCSSKITVQQSTWTVVTTFIDTFLPFDNLKIGMTQSITQLQNLLLLSVSCSFILLIKLSNKFLTQQ